METQGHVLESGLGKGLKLPHYTQQVVSLTETDDQPGMYQLIPGRMFETSMSLHPCQVSTENLPWPENSFDTVVCIFTLCSILIIKRSIAKIFLVLKPRWLFLFLEHGLCEYPRQQQWMHRLNPFQQRLSVGCNLNGDISDDFLKQPIEPLNLKRFVLEKVSAILGSCLRGMLRKSEWKSFSPIHRPLRIL